MIQDKSEQSNYKINQKSFKCIIYVKPILKPRVRGTDLSGREDVGAKDTWRG